MAGLRLAPDLPKEINVVACGSTVGNLLRFVRRHEADFRILVEKVGNTVFFICRENSPTELISGVRRYGHAFPEANTTWKAPIKGSSSHQRLIRYKFGGLDFLVRFEADGYIKESASPSPVVTSSKNKSDRDVSVDSLAGLLSGLTVPTQSAGSATSLLIKEGGTLVDQQRIFDLKTRSIKSRFLKDHLEEQPPRLWISQIPNFILAFHTIGVFKPEDTEVKDVRSEIDEWERTHSQDLARLAALVHEIIELVSASDDYKFELQCAEVGKLEVHAQLPDAGDALSPEVADQWSNLCSNAKSLHRGVQVDDSDSGYDETYDKDCRTTMGTRTGSLKISTTLPALPMTVGTAASAPTELLGGFSAFGSLDTWQRKDEGVIGLLVEFSTVWYMYLLFLMTTRPFASDSASLQIKDNA